ncbi:MAG: hypothetical protein ACLRSW_07670 [Christensenellaceae bacterium]
MKNAMSGTYSTGRVPALIEALDARTSETNHAGWTLAIVYENPSLPLCDLTLWCGGMVVSPSVESADITLSDFITPDLLPITGRLFGRDAASLAPISGPNNPEDNFLRPRSTIKTACSIRRARSAPETQTPRREPILRPPTGLDITAIDVSAAATEAALSRTKGRKRGKDKREQRQSSAYAKTDFKERFFIIMAPS